MKLQVMAAYDSKAKAFLNPFYCSQVAVGVRSFAEAANTPGHQIFLHLEDFILFHLGTYNDDNAIFEFITPYANLGMAVQYKSQNPVIREKSVDVSLPLGKNNVQSKVA